MFSFVNHGICALAAQIFQWRGEVAPGLPDFSEADRKHVGEELSDVLLYLVRTACVLRHYSFCVRKCPTVSVLSR